MEVKKWIKSLKETKGIILEGGKVKGEEVRVPDFEMTQYALCNLRA